MITTRSRVLLIVLGVLFVLTLSAFGYANWRAGSKLWEVGVNSMILAVPLILLYGSIWLLVAASQQKRSQPAASPRLAKWIYLAPRIAGILISLFVGMFALDVFDERGLSVGQQILAFLLHAAPAIVLLIVMAIAWRWPVVGSVAFTLAALVLLRFLLFNPLQGLGNVLLFAGPMAVIAALFWMNWKWIAWLRPSGGAGDGGERQNDDREQQVQPQE